jgi:U6 snRNA-associated Sm-like protein LSm7
MDSIMGDYSMYIDKKVIIHFSGGKEIFGLLKGFNQVSDLVMDEAVEIIKNKEGNEIRRRKLGIVIVRGPNVIYFFH